MAKSFTMAQLIELLDIHENTIIKIFTNRIENMESKQLKDEIIPLQESVEFRNETYDKMKMK